VTSHKNSENTHIERIWFLVKINTVARVYKIKIKTVAKGNFAAANQV
jgi:hypothetical protein